MSGNGRALAQISEEMWERQLDRTDALEEGQGRTLAEASRAAKLSQLTYDRLGPIEKGLGEMLAWKNTADGERVVNLTRQVTALEGEKQKAAEEKRRDWLDLRRTITGVIVTALLIEALHRLGIVH